MDNGASSYRRFRDNGDIGGLEEIIRNYRDGLILYLCSIVGDIQLAEEIAEDTFVLLGTKKPADKGTGSFKTWLYTIGRNKAINELRRKSRRKDISLDECPEITSDEADLEEIFIKDERNIILHRTLRKLKRDYRQILWLIYFENLSIRQSAEIMKKSVHSTETLVYRARLSLKKQLEKEGFTYEEL